MKAKVETEENEKYCQFKVAASLVNENRQSPKGKDAKYSFNYLIDADKVEIRAQQINASINVSTAKLVLPIISPTGEKVQQISPKRIEITKPEGLLIVEANVPLQISEMEKERAFNMVPGVEAIPIFASFENDKVGEIICTVRVL